MLACKNCQANLTAFLHHELPPLKRREVAKHLDECGNCYVLYLQEQDLMRNLAQTVPLIGHEYQPAFNRVWAAIQKDIAHPRRAVRPYPARYGFVAVVVTLMLVVPLTLGNRNLPLILPATQPSPLVIQATPGSTENAEVIVSAPQISLTPEAKAITKTGPSPDAISTP